MRISRSVAAGFVAGAVVAAAATSLIPAAVAQPHQWPERTCTGTTQPVSMGWKDQAGYSVFITRVWSDGTVEFKDLYGTNFKGWKEHP